MKLVIAFIAMIFAGILAAPPASASVLAVTGGTPSILPSTFDLSVDGLAPGDPIVVFHAGDLGGLTLLQGGTVTYEYIGSEAAYRNFATNTGGIFDSFTSSVGALIHSVGAVGFVHLNFGTFGGATAVNGGDIDAGVLIAFANVGPNAFIAMFDDAFGDGDFDDLVVRVSAVPLPPAAMLFITALLSLFLMARRKDNIA